MDKVKQYLNYIIIGIVSLIALVFLPMLGGTIGLNWNIPNTLVGWIVWVTVKLIVATLNVLIFHCFMQQAKVNVKDNENYKRARDILIKQKEKDVSPRSPNKWNSQQYIKKGTTIFISTGLSTIALTQAILSFDYVSMLTYLFTVVMGLIFGTLQMKTAEEYWTDEFLQYALMKEGELNQEANRDLQEDNTDKVNIPEQSVSPSNPVTLLNAEPKTGENNK